MYTTNLADIQTVTRGTSKLAAGYNTTLQSIVPVVLTPLTGLFFDRVGWRMPFGEYRSDPMIANNHYITYTVGYRR